MQILWQNVYRFSNFFMIHCIYSNAYEKHLDFQLSPIYTSSNRCEKYVWKMWKFRIMCECLLYFFPHLSIYHLCRHLYTILLFPYICLKLNTIKQNSLIIIQRRRCVYFWQFKLQIYLYCACKSEWKTYFKVT